MWLPSTVQIEDWGRLRVIVDGQDVTFFRDVPVVPERLSWADPFGPERATIHFPQITPFEQLGTGALSWLRDWAIVKVQRILPDESEGDVIWQGLWVDEEDSSGRGRFGLTLNCIGLVHQTSLYLKRPENIDRLDDIGVLIFRALWRRLRRHYRFDFADDGADPDLDAPVTGISSNYRGNWETLDRYLLRLLELVPEWTIDLDETGTALITQRSSLAAVSWTATTGTRGIVHQLVRDLLLTPNVIYGQGIDKGGTRWSNLYPIDPGEDPAENLWYQPIAYDLDLNPYDEVAGDLVLSERGVDLSKIRFEAYQDFGQGFTLPEAKAFADTYRQNVATATYAGTLTLEADWEEGHRLDTRPNQVALLKAHRGVDRAMHIARVEADLTRDAPVVTCAVDEARRRAPTLDEMLRGGRERARNPIPQLRLGHRAQEQTAFPWDPSAGGGFFPNEPGSRRHIDPAAAYLLPGGAWHVRSFLASERDSIIRTEVRTVTDSSVNGGAGTRFYIAFFNIEPPIDDLIALAPDPLSLAAGWNDIDGLLIEWGQNGQACGYSPGLESDADAITGDLIDTGTWQYTHDEVDPGDKQPAFLWLAFWGEDDCVMGGRLSRGVGQQV